MKNKPKRIRNVRLEINLTEIESQLLKDKAKYCNLSQSAYLRVMITDGLIIKNDIDGIKNLCNEMNHIGVNINQIARHVNEKKGDYGKREIELLQEQFQKLYKLIMDRMILNTEN